LTATIGIPLIPNDYRHAPTTATRASLAGFLRHGLAVLALLSLAACGGGGGGGGGSLNTPPSASFTATPASGTAPLTVSFDAGASVDADGTIASYAWTFGDGAIASGIRPSHQYTTPGTYTATLTVTDTLGAVGTATRSIVVSSMTTNVPPVAAFTPNPASGTAPLAVAFDASASSDSDGSIASYAWNFGDGATGTGVPAARTYATAGTYTVTLTVTDNQGASGTTTRTVTVANASGNVPPVASFTSSVTSGQAPLTVTFDASASSDSDGIASYAWTFGDGGIGTGVSPARTYTTAGTYTVTLTVTDNRGATGSATRTITVTPATPGSVSVSGRIGYARVPLSTNLNQGLDYAATTNQPARGIVVELIQASNQSILATTTTNADGRYGFNVTPNVNVFVRAKAQARRSGTPSWDIGVFNNTGTGRPLYVLDSSVFNTGNADQVRDLFADSGWVVGSSRYSGTRAAAPFAIVDTLYSAVQFVVGSGDTNVVLPTLQVFWATANNGSSGTWDPANGAIQSTLYRSEAVGGFPEGIYVLGLDGVDTDEYDQHVIAHEFQHYLEDKLSRTDTLGGDHTLSDRLDMRVAFSEGFSNAFSAMVLNDPQYSDTLGAAQGSRFTFSLESNTAMNPGWFNEASVHSLVWDLYDAQADGVDTVSIGFGPMYQALRDELRTGTALTSVYPFTAALQSRLPAQAGAIGTLMQDRQVFGSGPFGAGESNAGTVSTALPVYTDVALNGSAQRVCTSRAAGTYNKLGNRVFLRFSLGAPRTVSIRADYTSTGSTSPFTPTPDPDIVLFRGGFLAISEASTANTETLTRALEPGDYVVEVYEYSHADSSGTSSRRGVTCFNVSITG
jgi:PKD repeat protein